MAGGPQAEGLTLIWDMNIASELLHLASFLTFYVWVYVTMLKA